MLGIDPAAHGNEPLAREALACNRWQPGLHRLAGDDNLVEDFLEWDQQYDRPPGAARQERARGALSSTDAPAIVMCHDGPCTQNLRGAAGTVLIRGFL